VDAHAREILAEHGLHASPDGGVERLAGAEPAPDRERIRAARGRAVAAHEQDVRHLGRDPRAR
jgi:hypothetical protein